MKALCAAAALGLSLVVSIGSASAQPYGGYDRPYRDRDVRERDYRDRDYGERDRGPRGRDREYAFDEGEYLRCHPDVRRAVNRGDMESGYVHYRRHGRGEGRRLSC